MKLSIATPKGEITVIPATDPNYPGVYIEINGVQAALVEFDSSDQQHVVRVWNEEKEDHIFKQRYSNPLGAGETDYIKTLISDTQLVAENEGVELTDDEILEVANRMASHYDYSEYNESISSIIENVKAGVEE